MSCSLLRFARLSDVVPGVLSIEDPFPNRRLHPGVVRIIPSTNLVPTGKVEVHPSSSVSMFTEFTQWCVQMSQIKELRALTGLRGVAAVLVILDHYWQGIQPTNPAKAVLAHGYLAVDLFFVLSGFVMTLNYASFFHPGFSVSAFRLFLSRRIARVYPLYLVCTLVAFLLILVGQLGWIQIQSLWTALPLNLLMIQAWGFGNSFDGPCWSISAEWAAYLFFPASLWLAFQGGKLRTGVTVLVSAACVLFLCVSHPMIMKEETYALLEYHASRFAIPVLRCIPEFLLGVAVARIYVRREGLRFIGLRYATAATCALVLLLMGTLYTDFLVVMLFPVLVLLLAVADSLPARILGGRVCHHLGLISYSLYLVHDLLAGLMGWIHRTANGHGLQHGQTYAALIAIPIAYGLSLLSYHWIEVPGRNFFRAMLRPQGAPSAAKVTS